MPDADELPPTMVTGFYDASGAIAVNHECKRCGYNLRGLRETGRCPECGTPVGLSVRGEMLRYADPDWLDKVALGLKIILLMIVVGFLAEIVSDALNVVSPSASSVLALAASLVSFYGAWLMTEPDPSGIGEDPNLTVRKVVRITLVFGLAGEAAGAIVEAATGTFMWALVGMVALGSVIGLVGEFAKFIYYQRLAERIPDYALADRARFLRWAYTIALGIAVICGVVAFALMGFGTTAPGSSGAGVIGFSCMVGIASIALIVFGVMTLLMLIRLQRCVAEQTKLARDSWEA